MALLCSELRKPAASEFKIILLVSSKTAGTVTTSSALNGEKTKQSIPPAVFRKKPRLEQSSWLQRKQLVRCSALCRAAPGETFWDDAGRRYWLRQGNNFGSSTTSGFTTEPPAGFMFQSHYDTVSVIRILETADWKPVMTLQLLHSEPSFWQPRLHGVCFQE